jgi:hypothetical protein
MEDAWQAARRRHHVAGGYAVSLRVGVDTTTTPSPARPAGGPPASGGPTKSF